MSTAEVISEIFSTREIISIVAIFVAVITFIVTNAWNYKNHKKDIKKDTLLKVSGAINRQTQLIIKMADVNTEQTEINKVLSENEFIFGQMFTAANAETSKVVLEYLANIAETIFEIGLQKGNPECDQRELFSFALSKHTEHMLKMPKVISVIKKELGIAGGVLELDSAIKTGCDLINSKIKPLLKSAGN
ncbi:hypothetical protein [Moritella sp.]|uniref:hypothetical protein n=1 Tax=Moritella sp. TaxID=78556 RepID=UPI001D82082A|nr:hypothetical protein [Moritella sp.]MCJ8350892.1 hypothetical protein [Moritella sp.]NQZ40422.1 hypothetical protein [Moritella sp.]